MGRVLVGDGYQWVLVDALGYRPAKRKWCVPLHCWALLSQLDKTLRQCTEWRLSNPVSNPMAHMEEIRQTHDMLCTVPAATGACKCWYCAFHDKR